MVNKQVWFLEELFFETFHTTNVNSALPIILNGRQTVNTKMNCSNELHMQDGKDIFFD